MQGVQVANTRHCHLWFSAVIQGYSLAWEKKPWEKKDYTLISPACTLVGCQIGRNCYLATAVMVFQGAVIGEDSRISAGAIVHLKTILPPQTHVGIRHIAVPAEHGPLITADIQAAREQIATADFFGSVFQEQ